MSPFIQPLESRTLFAATFAAEQAQVAADAAAARAALKSAATTMASNLKTLRADLRPLSTILNRIVNAGLLSALKADTASSLATLRQDGRNLLSKSSALARRVAATGNALAARPGNPTLMERLAADLPALRSATATAAAQLQADLAAVDLGPELAAITAANPLGIDLITHAAAALTSATGALAAFGAAAATFQADVAILADHVEALPDTPAMMGTWRGEAIETFGPEAGLHIVLVAKFTSQGIDGALAGTVRGTPTGGETITMTLVGTITEDGSFTATATPTGNLQSTTTLTGTLSGNTLSGTYTTATGGGTFTLTRA